MRIPLPLLIIVVVLSLGVDIYIYLTLKRRCRSALPSSIQLWSAAGLYLMIIVGLSLPRRGGDNSMLLTVMWILFTYLSVYLAKIVYVVIDLLSGFPRLWRGRRWRWLSVTGVIAGCAAFLTLWWGALVNRGNIDVREVTVDIAGLPDGFDGYRIVQISDLHSGTFGTDTAFTSRLVSTINSLRPDLIAFTGDIVNSRSSELIPQVEVLSRLTAPDGVVSILGNHDYGDYSDWPSAEAKRDNLDQLVNLQRAMGWDLLLNETRTLHRGGDSIAVIGVENIGDPPFKIYGSLPKAYPALGDSVTKILLTHNPSHWIDSIAGRSDVNVGLSLSGHTHAMQIEILGWSPAKYRYPTWGGLYSDRGGRHQLYVNIGAGTVGFPARIGATPEITLITLKPLSKSLD